MNIVFEENGVTERKGVNVDMERFKKMEAFDAPFLQEKLVMSGEFETENQYQVAFSEFKKYAFLTSISNINLPMLSRSVDKVWHQFILFTRNYHAFCNEYLKGYLHHRPNTNFTPSNTNHDYFLDLYEEVFGSVPSIWLKGIGADCSDCSDCTDDGIIREG